MHSRALPIFNAIGCLVLTALVLVQWRKERALDASLTGTRAELVIARNQVAEQSARCSALDRDIAVLKESIEATQQVAEAIAKNLAEKEQVVIKQQQELAAARDQVILWESALKARDERIRALDADIAAARQRLNEAIAKLKEAGAR